MTIFLYLGLRWRLVSVTKLEGALYLHYYYYYYYYIPLLLLLYTSTTTTTTTTATTTITTTTTTTITTTTIYLYYYYYIPLLLLLLLLLLYTSTITTTTITIKKIKKTYYYYYYYYTQTFSCWIIKWELSLLRSLITFSCSAITCVSLSISLDRKWYINYIQNNNNNNNNNITHQPSPFTYISRREYKGIQRKNRQQQLLIKGINTHMNK